MRKLAIGIGVLILAFGGVTLSRSSETNDKLPKCSHQLCLASGCSPDVLCVRGAAVVTCADICKH